MECSKYTQVTMQLLKVYGYKALSTQFSTDRFLNGAKDALYWGEYTEMVYSIICPLTILVL